MRRDAPEVNAGSMADIAFLLLIFFLVTAVIDTDQGIFTKLPRKNPDQIAKPFKDKNILDIIINPKNELQVEGEVVEVSAITEIAMKFIDNGGGTDRDGNKCLWCQGEKDPASSDHPAKALIAIDASRAADYGTYIQVLDHVRKAYGKLRDRYAMKTYQMSYRDLESEEKIDATNREQLREKILDVRTKYPLLVTDSQVQN